MKLLCFPVQLLLEAWVRQLKMSVFFQQELVTVTHTWNLLHANSAGTSEIDLSSPLNYGTPSSRLGVGTPRTPGAVGTPIRPRPDVRSERKMRTVNVGGGGSEPVSRRILKSELFIAKSPWFD